MYPVTNPDLHQLSVADLVFVGTWVDGLVLFGQRPGRATRLWKLPVLDHKPVAVFCTYAINAGKALDKTVAILEAKGARVVGSRQFRRDRIERRRPRVRGLGAAVRVRQAPSGNSSSSQR